MRRRAPLRWGESNTSSSLRAAGSWERSRATRIWHSPCHKAQSPERNAGGAVCEGTLLYAHGPPTMIMRGIERMTLVDSLVDACFRNEKAGRVVIFPGDRRNRGYVVKSEADEQKIRSFLKMFFCAHLDSLTRLSPGIWVVVGPEPCVGRAIRI